MIFKESTVVREVNVRQKAYINIQCVTTCYCSVSLFVFALLKQKNFIYSKMVG